jgi:hypothetical protein
MKKSVLKDKETEELVELIRELRMKLKRKHQRLATTELRLGKAKDTVNRLQGIVLYQRERILELYKEQVPVTRDVINNSSHD